MSRSSKAKKEYAHERIVDDYVQSVLSGKKIACEETKQCCERYLRYKDKYVYNPRDAEYVILIIETTFVHQKGEALDGTPLRGKHLELTPWQCFCVYNILSFFKPENVKERVVKEVFIYIPRKNGKTSFMASLAWALAMLQRKSGSAIYITSAVLDQSLQSFNFIKYNLDHLDPDNQNQFRILNNNQEHTISKDFGEEGSIYIKALAANPDKQDSLNCNVGIADEIHAYKNPKQYNIIKEAMKAYTNKLMIGITTAGDDMNSFCYRRVEYCKKVLNRTIEDDSMFIFMAKAPEDEKGNVDYLNPVVHEMANPSYGITIRPEDMLNDARQAQNDPQQRKDFFAKSLNVYTAAMTAYFDIKEFRHSDRQFNWSLKELAKLPINWYGGADLSKMYDLTAACLYGTLENYHCKNADGVEGEYDVDIIIPHAWFPITQAKRKAEEDGIPLFGWEEDGWLTMCNSPTVNYAEIVNWFIDMKKMGFKIKEVGHDRKFCREYFVEMKAKKFKIVDQPQYFYKKSEGFRHIEDKAKNGLLYYMHSEAYEYCVQNVKAIEKTDDMIQYEKIQDTSRIDIFDASVFACVRREEALEHKNTLNKWFGGTPKDESNGYV